MKGPFNGNLSFCQIDTELPSAATVLKGCSWKTNHYNAPYLAGKADEPKHELVRLTDEVELPQAWSEADTLTVVGDISHALSVGSDIIVARTSDFKQVGKLAEKLDYRPALAGEFLQLLWWLRQCRAEYNGQFFCYAGRQPGYATLAQYNCYQEANSLHIIFDTHIGNAIEEGYLSANSDTYCFFVRN